jgi:putative FmdB family regulatory protein
VPTYEYACTACGDKSEVVQRFSDDALTVCTECGGKLRKVFSPVGIVFKGSGFYRTDSRNGSGSATAAKDGAAKDGAGKGSNGSSAESSGGSSSSESAKNGSSGGESSDGKSSGGKSSDGKSSGGKTDSSAGKSDSSGGEKKSSVAAAG